MHIRSTMLAGVALTLLCPPLAAAHGAPRGIASAPAHDVKADDVKADVPALHKLVQDLKIDYGTFTLPNGLKGIVVTDRSVPVVSVTVAYDVGSTSELPGRSGFAHLFEHLMFNGSENAPGDYFPYLRDAGMLMANGGTTFDKTMYYEIVPTGSLDRVLFLESDRMGHMLGAVTQAVLDEQRGVVQNEKRNGDNNPSSIIGYRENEALYPPGHPYGHGIIGSMKDLNAASLQDVHQFFRDHYGPNNATIILAGDIDLATAREKVARYFGDIPRGKETVDLPAPVPVLKKPIVETLTGPVTATTFYRTIPTPGDDDPEARRLSAVAALLSRIDGAPLDKLVRDDKLFSSLYASGSLLKRHGSFDIQGQIREGVDPKVAERALDATIAKFLKEGVTQSTLDRWKATAIISAVNDLDDAPSRANQIQWAQSRRGSPANYKADYEAILALTPAEVMATARKYLTRPYYQALLVPGPRMTAPGDEQVTAKAVAPAQPAAAPASAVAAQARVGGRGPVPPVGPPGDITFPSFERAKLANGVPVVYARSEKIPFTYLSLEFPFGQADLSPTDRYALPWAMGMLDEGAGGHDDHWFTRQKEVTGASVSAYTRTDESGLSVSTPTAMLGKALDRAMLMLTKPDFPIDRLEDSKRRKLNGIRIARDDDDKLVSQVFPALLDANSPYTPLKQLDDPSAIRALTPQTMRTSFHKWIRPKFATLYVVSNEPLAKILPQLDATLGTWSVAGTAPAAAPAAERKPVKSASPRVVLIDMPDSVQASVTGGQLVDLPYRDENFAAQLGNTALGGGFTARINMNVREDKHWSYGASGAFSIDPMQSSYQVSAQVQPDKVGPAIDEIRKEVRDFVTTRPMTRQEFEDNRDSILRRIVGRYASGMSYLGAMSELARYGRPDAYPLTVPAKMKAVTLDEANAAMRKQLDPSKWVWVVTGNAKVIRPQLDALGLPVEVVKPDDLMPKM